MSVFDPKNNSNNLGNQTNPNAESKNEVIAPEVDAIFGNPAVVSLVEGAKYAGFGGVCGYCTGAAVKSIGKQIAGVLGAAFIGLQVLNYYGYIGNVNYDRISQDVSKVLDVNGDGKLDVEDAKIISSRAYKILTHQLPCSAGFAVGAYYGLRS